MKYECTLPCEMSRGAEGLLHDHTQSMEFVTSGWDIQGFSEFSSGVTLSEMQQFRFTINVFLPCKRI